LQTLEHWITWKEKCAAALCPPETRLELENFAHVRFRRFAAACAHATNVHDANALTPTAGEALHCFEAYLQLRNSREGKVYKEWLFNRASVAGAPTLDSIQGGASVLMRDVVREQLRREFSSEWMTALDAPIGVGIGGSEMTLFDLLPDSGDTRTDVERREMESIAASDAGEFLTVMGHRERVALLARVLGLSLAHKAVTTLAGCGKSVLFDIYNNTLQKLARHIRSAHPREDRSTLASLTAMAFDRLKELILEWKDSEKACAQLSLLIEQEHEKNQTQR
jgi:hypothetical protein